MGERPDLKSTVNLPRTDFAMKANLPENEPKRLAWWAEKNVYQAIRDARRGRPLFVLHDGPPYANNNIHLGQALNKILKDFVLKSRSMMGHEVPYVPGWDCHGLPIEHRVDLDLGASAPSLPALEKRRRCREYAERFIGIQREEFRRLGVFWDWKLDSEEEAAKRPDRKAIYRTIDREYEAVIVEALGTFFAAGSVYHGRKPVHWCFSCRTALAEAEVEYEERNDPSIYVKFPLSENVAGRLPGLAAHGISASARGQHDARASAPVSVVIWTTTPWTLPANLAVALHPDLVYVAVAVGAAGPAPDPGGQASRALGTAPQRDSAAAAARSGEQRAGQTAGSGGEPAGPAAGSAEQQSARAAGSAEEKGRSATGSEEERAWRTAESAVEQAGRARDCGASEIFIVAEALLEATARACGWTDPRILLRFKGKDLAYTPEEIARAGADLVTAAAPYIAPLKAGPAPAGQVKPAEGAGAATGAAARTPAEPSARMPAEPAAGAPGPSLDRTPGAPPAAQGPWPCIPGRSHLILADYVTLDQGTGCVHTAPGHGADDFRSGQSYSLPPFNPVADDGTFEPGLVEPAFLKGVHVHEANRKIGDDLRQRGLLLHAERIQHSYPHCWRCKNPVLFRATPQWFVAMEANALRRRALAGIATARWTPSFGQERISGMIATRPDWCISRQRTWGVPIPAVVCRPCFEGRGDESAFLREPRFFAHVAGLFRAEGSDAWFGKPGPDGAHVAYASEGERIERLVPAGLACPVCGSRAGLAPQDPIVDVWFESGVSHEAVLPSRGLPWPADLYVEGHDQYRGWFHSSLLVGVGTRAAAPYRGVLTHGFTLYLNAKTGRVEKMSKSLGNVISPIEVCERLGADILRLWVAQVDFLEDMNVSPEILERNSEAYRKIRNTFRYLLGNLFDFEAARDALPDERLAELDRWALAELGAVSSVMRRAYESYEFHKAFHALNEFCAVTMSAMYLDIIKDRLYTSPPRSDERRSAQTALHRIADALCRLMAPILAFTAEEIWQQLRALPGGAGQRSESVHVELFPASGAEAAGGGREAELLERWRRLFGIRADVQKAIEEKRKSKEIGSSLAARLVVRAPSELRAFLESFGQELRFLFIVSELLFDDTLTGGFPSERTQGLSVLVLPAAGKKCERCWNITEDTGRDPGWPTACARCARALAVIFPETA